MTFDTKYCEYQTYPASLETPAEWCERDAVEGFEYCAEHMPVDVEYEKDYGWPRWHGYGEQLPLFED